MRLPIVLAALSLVACAGPMKKQREPAEARSLRISVQQAERYGMSIQQTPDFRCHQVLGGDRTIASGKMEKRHVDPQSKCVWKIKCDFYSGEAGAVQDLVMGTVQLENVPMEKCAEALKIPDGFCEAEKMIDEKDPLADCLREPAR